jgi:hypothetical protein
MGNAMSFSRVLSFLFGSGLGTAACISASLLTSGLLSGCGRAVYQVGEFQRYVTQFENESIARGHPIRVHDLIIEFGELPSNKNGNCRTSSVLTPKITINRGIWPMLDEPRREALLFHEIGHCVLGRPHDDAEVVHGGRARPESVMATYLLDSNVYQANRDAYLNELFTGNTAVTRGSQVSAISIEDGEPTAQRASLQLEAAPELERNLCD